MQVIHSNACTEIFEQFFEPMNCNITDFDEKVNPDIICSPRAPEIFSSIRYTLFCYSKDVSISILYIYRIIQLINLIQ